MQRSLPAFRSTLKNARVFLRLFAASPFSPSAYEMLLLRTHFSIHRYNQVVQSIAECCKCDMTQCSAAILISQRTTSSTGVHQLPAGMGVESMTPTLRRHRDEPYVDTTAAAADASSKAPTSHLNLVTTHCPLLLP